MANRNTPAHQTTCFAEIREAPQIDERNISNRNEEHQCALRRRGGVPTFRNRHVHQSIEKAAGRLQNDQTSALALIDDQPAIPQWHLTQTARVEGRYRQKPSRQKCGSNNIDSSTFRGWDGEYDDEGGNSVILRLTKPVEQ